MVKAKTNYTKMAKDMVAEAESKRNGYFEAVELPKIIRKALETGIANSKTSAGDIIYNGAMSGQYVLLQRNKDFIIMDLGGNEFKFQSFAGAAIFAAAASSTEYKYEKTIYNRVRGVIEGFKENLEVKAPTPKEAAIAVGEE